MRLCARSLVVSIDGSVALPYNVIKYAAFACWYIMTLNLQLS